MDDISGRRGVGGAIGRSTGWAPTPSAAISCRRLIYGAQITIFVALASSVLSFSLGAFLGFLAAVEGGWVDQVLSRIVDLVMAVPSLIVALVVLSVLPLNLTVLILVMGASGQHPRVPPVAAPSPWTSP